MDSDESSNTPALEVANNLALALLCQAQHFIVNQNDLGRYLAEKRGELALFESDVAEGLDLDGWIDGYSNDDLIGLVNAQLKKDAVATPGFIQEIANEKIDEIEGEIGELSGETKTVTVELSALTREYYSEEIVVPIEFDCSILDEIVYEAYDASDGSEFTPDNEYWEKGECTHSEQEDNF